MVKLGGSPGLVVMGDDSCPEGCGFKFHQMNIWTFFYFELLQKLYCLFEKTENKRKRGQGWSIF